MNFEKHLLSLDQILNTDKAIHLFSLGFKPATIQPINYRYISPFPKNKKLITLLRTEPEIEVLINPFISAYESEALAFF